VTRTDQQAEEFRDPQNADANWWLLNFYVELPFYLPYLHGAKYNVEFAGESWRAPVPDGLPSPPHVLLQVIQQLGPPPADPSRAMQATLQNVLHRRGHPDIRDVFDGDLQTTPPPLHIVSIVEAVTPKVMTESEVAAGLPHHPETYLNRCIAALNTWIRSTIVVTGEHVVRTVARENLPMFLAFFHQSPGDGTLVSFDMLRANENPATSSNQVATPLAVERVEKVASSLDETHLIFKAAELRVTALRLAAIEGRPDLAVILLNTAFELLVFGLARVLLVDEGATTDDIERQLGGRRLRARDVCYRFLQGRIGGQWDATQTSSPFGAVSERLVELRNRVAHRGVDVSDRQAQAAFEGYISFTGFVTRQVHARRRTYPRTFMDLTNAFRLPPDITVGENFSNLAWAIVENTPRYWLPADARQQSAGPPARVSATAGEFSPTTPRQTVTAWANSDRFFVRLISRPSSPDARRDP